MVPGQSPRDWCLVNFHVSRLADLDCLYQSDTSHPWPTCVVTWVQLSNALKNSPVGGHVPCRSSPVKKCDVPLHLCISAFPLRLQHINSIIRAISSLHNHSPLFSDISCMLLRLLYQLISSLTGNFFLQYYLCYIVIIKLNLISFFFAIVRKNAVCF